MHTKKRMSYLKRLMHSGVKALPHLLYTPLYITPFVVQKHVLEWGLNALFAERIREGELDFMTDRRLRIRVTDLPLGWDFTFVNGRISVQQPDASDADAIFSGDMNSFVLLSANQADPDTLFFRRRLHIGGDTEFALEVKALMLNLPYERLPKPLLQLLERHAHVLQQEVFS